MCKVHTFCMSQTVLTDADKTEKLVSVHSNTHCCIYYKIEYCRVNNRAARSLPFVTKLFTIEYKVSRHAQREFFYLMCFNPKHVCDSPNPKFISVVRVQLKCDGTRWRAWGEVRRKLANVVGSQYSSHYLGTWCIQHYYRWCAHLGCQ
jgi:hypothetical protein